MSMRTKNGDGLRWWHTMRPYELRHTDPRFMEWLRAQGLAEDNRTPTTGAVPSGPRRRS